MNKLGIIILHHNDPAKTSDALASLKKAWLPEKTEVIVINNGGQNANSQIPKKNYNNLKVKFLELKNNGYAHDNNVGIKEINAEYYLFMNPDITVEPDTIKILIDYLEKNPEVGIAAPRLLYPDKIIQDNFRTFPRVFDHLIKRLNFLRKIFLKRMRQYLMWDKDPYGSEPVDWVTGALMIASKKCLDKVGNHDLRFFLFMSDLSMCRDAWKNGFEVHFIGETQAYHHQTRLSAGGIFAVFRKKTLRIHIIDTLKYYLKYFGQSLPKKSPSLKNIPKKET